MSDNDNDVEAEAGLLDEGGEGGDKLEIDALVTDLADLNEKRRLLTLDIMGKQSRLQFLRRRAVNARARARENCHKYYHIADDNEPRLKELDRLRAELRKHHNVPEDVIVLGNEPRRLIVPGEVKGQARCTQNRKVREIYYRAIAKWLDTELPRLTACLAVMRKHEAKLVTDVTDVIDDILNLDADSFVLPT